MNVHEAKDFLVAQAVQQAAIDRVQLSDLEKRMMYFTEGPDAVENPIELNEAFEAEYDTAEYESKLSRLFDNARARLKKQDPSTLTRWKEAIRELQKGDHYILVLCNEMGPSLPEFSIRTMPRAIPIIVLGVILVVGLFAFYARYFHAPRPARFSAWFKYSLWATAIGAYLYFGILPLTLKQPSALSSTLKRFFRRKHAQR